jgi:DNA-directed RNA polymerase I subunit RPA1
MSKAVVNRYVCKLKLIQHGLLLEAQQLDDIQVAAKPAVKAGRSIAEEEGPGDDIESEDEDDMEAFFKKRNRFVEKAIKRNRANQANWNSAKVMSVAEERRALVKQFLADIIKPRKCNRCQA